MNIVTTYPNFTPLNLHPQVESAQYDAARREVVPAVNQTFNSANSAEIGSSRDRERQSENRFVQTSHDHSGEVSDDLTYSATVHGRNGGGRDDSDQGQSGSKEDNHNKNAEEKSSTDKLSDSEQNEVEKLKARDSEVRVHENRHKSVGGQYAGAPSYSYERGPDGKNYVTDGEVSISLSEEDSPEKTISKMRQVYSAALAPAEPSSQDRQVASEAKRIELNAQQEMREEKSKEDTSENPEEIAVKDSSSKNNNSSKKLSSASQDSNAHRQGVISGRYFGSWQMSQSSVQAYA